jgi:hypothetical protein
MMEEILPSGAKAPDSSCDIDGTSKLVPFQNKKFFGNRRSFGNH